MKYFLDTEFLEDGRRIELISIGVVCEDGREYYAINHNAPWQRILGNKWLRDNVVPHLPITITKLAPPNELKLSRWERTESPFWKTPAMIANELKQFVIGDDIEMWAYYGDYDWVATCRLFGRMIDLPPNWPKLCYDLRQWLNHGGRRSVRQPDDAPHNALEDARWVRATQKKYDTFQTESVYVRQGTNPDSVPKTDWKMKYDQMVIELTDSDKRHITEIERLTAIIAESERALGNIAENVPDLEKTLDDAQHILKRIKIHTS